MLYCYYDITSRLFSLCFCNIVQIILNIFVGILCMLDISLDVIIIDTLVDHFMWRNWTRHCIKSFFMTGMLSGGEPEHTDRRVNLMHFNNFWTIESLNVCKETIWVICNPYAESCCLKKVVFAQMHHGKNVYAKTQHVIQSNKCYWLNRFIRIDSNIVVIKFFLDQLKELYNYNKCY